jgi:hypothetical protein
MLGLDMKSNNNLITNKFKKRKIAQQNEERKRKISKPNETVNYTSNLHRLG